MSKPPRAPDAVGQAALQRPLGEREFGDDVVDS